MFRRHQKRTALHLAVFNTVEQLEQRILLTSCNVNIFTGIMTVLGDSNGTTIEIVYSGGNTTAKENGSPLGGCNSSPNTTSVSVSGGSGNDYISVSGGIPSTLLGDDGTDTILGGTAVDSIEGGAGADS